MSNPTSDLWHNVYRNYHRWAVNGGLWQAFVLDMTDGKLSPEIKLASAIDVVREIDPLYLPGDQLEIISARSSFSYMQDFSIPGILILYYRRNQDYFILRMVGRIWAFQADRVWGHMLPAWEVLSPLPPEKLNTYTMDVTMPDGQRVPEESGWALWALIFDLYLHFDFVEIMPGAILRCPLAELQQRAIQKYGLERLLEDLTCEIRHEQEINGRLHQLILVSLLGKRPGDNLGDTLCYLRAPDASTDRVYLLRVPHWIYSVDHALGWLFNMDGKEYIKNLEVET